MHMRFLKCEKCGNVIGMIEDSGVTPECCGEPMVEAKPEDIKNCDCKIDRK